jgi:peptidoglycan/LPS O-acetylase OafA/YrhL
VKFLYKLTDISNIKRISFRQDINGLRAIAVLAVVFYHAELEIFKGGWLGVDIFFVISGYLISNIIISELNEGTFSFKSFYLRRARRILPALFSTLLLTIPFAYFFLTPKAMDEYIESVISSVFFYANYHFMNLDFYIAESTKLMPLLHTWSLAIEEQYYLLFPLFAFIIYKYSKKYFTFFIGFITLGSLYLNTLFQSADKFYRLEFRIWELLLGVLIMILSSNLKIKHLEKIGLPLMLFPIFYFGDDWINDTEPKLIALIGISLIIFSNTESSFLTKILNIKIISIIGMSSYSIYLLHQPLFAFFRNYKNSSFENFLNRNTGITTEENIVLLFITLLIGSFNFRIVESYFLIVKNFKKIFILSSLFFITLFLLIISNNYRDNDIETVMNIDNYVWFQNNTSCLTRSVESICYVDNDESTNVYAFGDSHLAGISIHLASLSEKNNFNYYAYIGNGCLPISKRVSERYCVNFNLTELNEVISLVENSVILIGGRLPLYINASQFYNGYSQEPIDVNDYKSINFEQEIVSKIEVLLSNNNKVILIYPIPEQGWNVPGFFGLADFNSDDTVSYPAEVWYKRRESSYEIFDSIASGSIYRIYPEEIFCDSYVKNECVGAFKGKIFYSDDDHLSLDGTELVTEKIMGVLEDIIKNN